MTAETVTVTVSTVKYDPDTMEEFLSSSADTIPTHVSPKRENGADVNSTTHVLPSGTSLKPARIKSHELMEIDIDLWTMPIPGEPEKGPLKPMQVILDKGDVSTSDKATLSIKQGTGKPRKKIKLKPVNKSRNTKPKGK